MGRDNLSKLFVVGIGPGDAANMTAAASAAIESAEVLCGYSLYIDLVNSRWPGKEFYTTPMTKELQRCRKAVELAAEGKTVAMLCSGDAGVYGMAAPCIEAAEGTDVCVEIVPGVTAALSGAAVLGAPLGNDFCVISLSDLLTPWNKIEKRLDAAGIGDFTICLYNPMSKTRREHLKKACDILLRHKSGGTVCGWVRNIGRDGLQFKILTLDDLRDAQLDMLTTVFIGCSETYVAGGKMVTPRGYKEKYS